MHDPTVFQSKHGMRTPKPRYGHNVYARQACDPQGNLFAQMLSERGGHGHEWARARGDLVW